MSIVNFSQLVAKAYDKLPLAQSDAVALYEKFIQEASSVFENVKSDSVVVLHTHPIIPDSLLAKLEAISDNNPYNIIQKWKMYRPYFSEGAYQVFTTEYLGKNLSLVYGDSKNFNKVGILPKEIFK